MKRIWILFAIIYWVNNTSLCESETAPKNASVCYVKGTKYENNTCCFFSAISDASITKCYELPKDASKREEYIKVNYPAFTQYNHYCFGNFLEISLLLFVSLLLLWNKVIIY